VYQHGSAIVVPHCRDMNHWRCRSGLAIVFRATRSRGCGYAGHRVRRRLSRTPELRQRSRGRWRLAITIPCAGPSELRAARHARPASGGYTHAV
jgi:hypothetical protein